MCVWVLATLHKTLITSTYQIVVAVQHSPRGSSNPASNYTFCCLPACVAFFGIASTQTCCHYRLDLQRKSMHNQDGGLHCHYDVSAVYAAFPQRFKLETTDKFGISLLHSFYDWWEQPSKTEIAKPAFTWMSSPCEVAQTIAYVAIATILHPQNQFWWQGITP